MRDLVSRTSRTANIQAVNNCRFCTGWPITDVGQTPRPAFARLSSAPACPNPRRSVRTSLPASRCCSDMQAIGTSPRVRSRGHPDVMLRRMCAIATEVIAMVIAIRDSRSHRGQATRLPADRLGHLPVEARLGNRIAGLRAPTLLIRCLDPDRDPVTAAGSGRIAPLSRSAMAAVGGVRRHEGTPPWRRQGSGPRRPLPVHTRRTCTPAWSGARSSAHPRWPRRSWCLASRVRRRATIARSAPSGSGREHMVSDVTLKLTSSCCAHASARAARARW